ncbi:YidH family protein [Granulicella paludicola]|uniref:YidH family protein n=1 Tax=Granulicella paludicola TaxID=474951 RepID=UPI0021DFB771|nr:DUF202 domain-containing protein [Granulicella paludicola]
MDKPAERAPEVDPRVYFAAERTFLAWIRTGLGLMGVGFAVSRFGLFLREFSATQHTLTTNSVVTGVVLVALGVVINIVAVINHTTIVRSLAAGTWRPGKTSKPAIVLALVLAALGVAMAAYLLKFR